MRSYIDSFRYCYHRSVSLQLASSSKVHRAIKPIANRISFDSRRHCQGAFNNGMLILDKNTNDFTRLVHIDRQVRHPGWSIDMQKLNFDVLVSFLSALKSDLSEDYVE